MLFSRNTAATALASLAISAGAAHAATVTLSASEGTRSASAVFATSGNTLTVTLTNTSMLDAMQPIDILTGVFFDITGSGVSLTRQSAVVPGSSSILWGGGDAGFAGGLGVGGEWAYRSGLSGGPRGAGYGISSSGLGLFGPGDVFPGTNLQGPTTPDGLQYGITTAGDNPATGNTPVTGTQALIKNAVVFTLTGLPTAFDLARIRNVGFQYGTSLTEPSIYVSTVPLPTAAAAGLAAMGLLVARRRR